MSNEEWSLISSRSHRFFSAAFVLAVGPIQNPVILYWGVKGVCCFLNIDVVSNVVLDNCKQLVLNNLYLYYVL